MWQYIQSILVGYRVGLYGVCWGMGLDCIGQIFLCVYFSLLRIRFGIRMWRPFVLLRHPMHIQKLSGPIYRRCPILWSSPPKFPGPFWIKSNNQNLFYFAKNVGQKKLTKNMRILGTPKNFYIWFKRVREILAVYFIILGTPSRWILVVGRIWLSVWAVRDLHTPLKLPFLFQENPRQCAQHYICFGSEAFGYKSFYTTANHTRDFWKTKIYMAAEIYIVVQIQKLNKFLCSFYRQNLKRSFSVVDKMILFVFICFYSYTV